MLPMKKFDPALRPATRLKHRAVDESLMSGLQGHGLTSLQARIVAARMSGDLDEVISHLNPRLEDMSDFHLLADIDIAAQRLATAVITGEPIALFFDYDMDGIGGGSLSYTLLTEACGCKPDSVRCFVGNRLHDGYGLTESVAEHIKAAQKTGVVVTIDAGSKDGPRIEMLVKAGLDVIVTDHHTIDDIPDKAFACINPQRPDCRYPDKAVAGGFVVWMLIAATHEVLQSCGHPVSDSGALLSVWDFAACSTVADCVSLKSLNNRMIVQRGLTLINHNVRPCWQAIRPLLSEGDINAEDIGFGISPRVNATSRISEPDAALHFLLAENTAEAASWLSVIDGNNVTRKQIESEMKAIALVKAAEMVADGHYGLAIFLEDGHPGVQGICASRVTEAYGRPSFMFSPMVDDASLISGSARSIEAFDSHAALEQVQLKHPSILQKWGGHKAACGATLRREDFPVFAAAYEEVVRDQLSESDLGPVVMSDGELAPHELTLSTVDSLAELDPFGRGFESPIFDNTFRIIDVRPVGKVKIHAQLTLLCRGVKMKGIWFFVREDEEKPLPVMAGQIVHLAYALSDNIYRGRRSLQINIKSLVVL